MKLTRCYIENFGTLHQFDMKLQGGVAVIKAPNGFGKSTFAAFIRAMLYGFPRGNKANLEKDHRRKYAPWQGGRCGGCIEFEVEDKTYRLERFFGDKPTADSFAVYELPEMRPCKRFTENIGVELFGLDAESFERSAYMSALSETGALSTDTISAKLSSLVEDTGDAISYDKAVAGLKKARAGVQSYRGNGGEVFAAGEKISALQNELYGLKAEREKLPALYAEIAELEEKNREKNAAAEALRTELIRASAQTEQAALYRERCGLIRRREELEAEREMLFEDYPNGIPSLEELEAEPLETEEKDVDTGRKSPVLTVFLILALLVAAGGTALMLVLKNYALGGVIISVGLLFAAAGLYFHYRRIADSIEDREKKKAQTDLVRERYLLLRDGALQLDAINKRALALEREIAEFDAAHPDVAEAEFVSDVRGESMREQYVELGRAMPELNRRIAEKRREAELLEEKTACIAEKENALEHFKSVKNEGLLNAQALDNAVEYLTRARESLSKGYLSRLERGFARYLNLLGEGEDGRVLLGSDLSVKLERGGEARTLEYFSAGFSDMVMLCMRLALIDALFEGEKPFIIMDDPFVNLDDEHTKKALELVKTLGREYQVLYLTCSASRA